jgi:hypothetical protein
MHPDPFTRPRLFHRTGCPCVGCRKRALHSEPDQPVQRITTDAPSGSLPQTSVSVHELLGNSRTDYHVGEDWNDD